MGFKKQNMNIGEGRKKMREANSKRHIENKLRVAEGGRGWAKWVMGIKKSTCWDEHWVLYVNDESINSPPEASITPYGNYLEFK